MVVQNGELTMQMCGTLGDAIYLLVGNGDVFCPESSSELYVHRGHLGRIFKPFAEVTDCKVGQGPDHQFTELHMEGFKILRHVLYIVSRTESWLLNGVPINTCGRESLTFTQSAADAIIVSRRGMTIPLPVLN